MFTRRHTLAALAVLTATAAAAPATTQAAGKPDVTVMSRNLYLGADIIKLATAASVDDQKVQASQLYKNVVQTDFPRRAKAIAAEVKTTKPDVIALQEVARYYKGPDGVQNGGTDANQKLNDWLELLQKELKADKLSYKVTSEQLWMNVETAVSEGYDLRLTQSNVVLVKTGKGSAVKFKKDVQGKFKEQLSVPLKDQTVTLSRGWAGVEATVAGKRFRILAPHAEAYSDDIATAQFKDLVARGAKNKKLTTIIAGDFNSDPAQQGPGSAGYNAVIGAGFNETGKRAATCCQDELLDNTTSKLETWIDHIVVRPKAKVLKSQVVGTKLFDGIWPSDHAGVVATLRLK
jgi:endonuclease/exonuclease/phosphatase family metal-dependent hydrolase